jgi:glutathione synthase/RimK-type ligase-like ATP-grasp enzyme
VATAINKISCFKALALAGLPTVKWTTNKEDVAKWLKKGREVFVRKEVTGQGGSGITILQTETALVDDAPLYTRNFPKTHEFRFHVAFGRVIDLTEKRARINDGRAESRYIRNARTGWVFAHQLSRLHPEDRDTMEKTAIAAIKACGLDFGAVDLLAIIDLPQDGGRMKKHVVCEINTGPGLENTATILAYELAFRSHHTHLRGLM